MLKQAPDLTLLLCRHVKANVINSCQTMLALAAGLSQSDAESTCLNFAPVGWCAVLQTCI